MEKITETNIINKYLDETEFQSYFSDDIKNRLEIHKFFKSERLIFQGSILKHLYFLISGKAKIYMTHENGKRSIIDFINEPTFIGEITLIGVEKYTKEVVAMDECYCFAILLSENKNKLLNDSTFLLSLCKQLGNKTLSRTERYIQEMNYPFENRLAAFILMVEHNNIYNEKHTEVSEYLNISYRHLLGTLNNFCQDGFLNKHGREFLIKNKEALKKLNIDQYLNNK